MTAKPSAPKPRHTIQVVARRTGLSPDLIRAWEKRYGAVEPERTATNRRLYSDEEVERLALLHRATLAGHPIGQVAALDAKSLAALLEDDSKAAASAPRRKDSPTRLQQPADGRLDSCLEAIEQLDGVKLRALLLGASVELPAEALIESLISPLTRVIGERWELGELRVGEEHLASAVLRSTLETLLERTGAVPGAPSLIVATPSGQRHELGALMAAALAADWGWRVVYLGADLPCAEIADAAARQAALAVALSLVYPSAEVRLERELKELRALLGPDRVILAGGRAAASYQRAFTAIGGRIVTTFAQLSDELSQLRRGATPAAAER